MKRPPFAMAEIAFAALVACRAANSPPGVLAQFLAQVDQFRANKMPTNFWRRA